MEKLEITSIWFESDNWANPCDENDGNMDVIFTLSNKTKWAATFFTYQNILSLSRKNKATGECLNGHFFCAKDMILIDRLNKENIRSVLDEMLKEDNISAYCSQIEDWKIDYGPTNDI